MKDFFKIILILFWWGSSSNYLSAGSWSVLFRNGIEPKSFANRFEKEIRQELEIRDIAVYERTAHMGASPLVLTLDLRYPLRIKPGEVNLLIKCTGLPEGVRYMRYSHASHRDGDMSVQQSRLFSKRLIKHLLEVLSSELNDEKRLLSGMYANHYPIEIGTPLDIELLGPKVSQGREQNPFGQRESSTSLVEESYLLVEEPLGPEPELRKKAKRRNVLLRRLDENWEEESRGKAYLELSELYASEGLKDEALEYVEAALDEAPLPEAQLHWRSLQGPEALPLQRLRRRHQDKGADLLVSNAIEYDSNVLLESVDALDPKRVDSWRVFNALNLSQRWRGEWRNWRHLSRVRAFSEFYNAVGDLNILGGYLGHELRYDKKTKGSYLLFSIASGYYHYLNRGEKLMQGFEGDMSLSVMRNNKDMFGVGVKWRKKSYGETFYSQPERDGSIARIELLWQHVPWEAHSATIRLGLVEDDIGDETLSYRAWRCDGRYRMPCPWLFFDTMSAEGGYESRSYEKAEFARTLREDAQFEVGLSVEANPFVHHQLVFSYRYTENQSNRGVNYYLRRQFRCTYEIAF
jgi:hypothetical protein